MNKKVHGSFTIEAVFVMPIVLFTVVSVIYLSFFLYDYCRIQGIADTILHKGALNLKHEADFETGNVFYEEIGNQGVFYQLSGISDSKIDMIENLLSAKLSKGLLVTKITNIEVSADILKVVIKIEGKLNIPIKGVAQMFSVDRIFMVEVKGKLHNPANTVRISEVILELGSNIKGLDKLKNKVKTLSQIP